MKTFKSILQFQKAFDTDKKCRAFLEHQRWGETPCCHFCASINVTRLKDGKRFQCNEKQCRKQFTVTVGTVYENTKVSLPKWFLATYILTVHSKGISSLQLKGWLDVSLKTAWFLNHRIREMLKDKQPTLLRGVVEVDETWVGGSISNKHVSKRKNYEKNDNKTMVFGAVQREGKVRTKVIPAHTKDILTAAVKGFVDETAIMVSDEFKSYSRLKRTYSHVKVNHSAGKYVIGAAHTNTIEGFWSLLKRQIVGIHHQVSPKHLQRYCDESAWRYNQKGITQDVRFAEALANCEGRLKYRDLVNTQTV